MQFFCFHTWTFSAVSHICFTALVLCIKCVVTGWKYSKVTLEWSSENKGRWNLQWKLLCCVSGTSKYADYRLSCSEHHRHHPHTCLAKFWSFSVELTHPNVVRSSGGFRFSLLAKDTDMFFLFCFCFPSDQVKLFKLTMYALIWSWFDFSSQIQMLSWIGLISVLLNMAPVGTTKVD